MFVVRVDNGDRVIQGNNLVLMVIKVEFVEEDSEGHLNQDNRDLGCLVLVQLLLDNEGLLIQKNISTVFLSLYLVVNNLQLV